jgi:nucleoside-diphosphate-sugar epimerase
MMVFEGDGASAAAGSRRGGRLVVRSGGRLFGHSSAPRILVVGCGDVGRRLLTVLGSRYRVFATVRSIEGAAALRDLGAIPIVADLDDPRTLDRLGGIASMVVHLAPPPSTGHDDPRTRFLLRVLRDVERMVYVSTSGVYGDCRGAAIDETRAVAPTTDRARRRVDAERQLRAWAGRTGTTLSILRVPGIYAADRLPLARLAAGTPALRPEDDVHTNHIHADDLARIVALAIFRGAPQRIYHAVDDSALRMGDWFDLVADTHDLPRPERLARDAIEQRISPALLSFMSESRRLSNRRMHEELGARLRYPTVREGLAASRIEAGAAPASS